MMEFRQHELATYDISSLVGLTVSFLLNIVMICLIIGYIYRSFNSNKGILFSLYLFNIVVFALTVAFQSETITLGSGFGMFVIFAMMRYRSEVVSLKDMTYLLIVITLGILHGCLSSNGRVMHIIFMDVAILAAVFYIEKKILGHFPIYKKIKYNNLEMIKPENKEKLWKEINQKTALNVLDVKFEGLNLIENSVTLCVFYEEDNSGPGTKISLKDSDKSDAIVIQSKSPENKFSRWNEIFQRIGTCSLKIIHTSWLLLVILISLLLLFGVTFDGFAILT